MKNTPSEKPQQDVPGVSITESLEGGSQKPFDLDHGILSCRNHGQYGTAHVFSADRSDGGRNGLGYRRLFSSIMTIGSLCGAIFMPVLAGKLGSNKPLMIGACVVGGIGSCFSWLAPVGPVLGICLFITGFCISGLMPLLMSLPVQLPGIGPEIRGNRRRLHQYASASRSSRTADLCVRSAGRR